MSTVTHPTITVFTGPAWLIPLFDGYTKGNSRIEVNYDALQRPFINKAIATDPTWNLHDIVNGKPIIEWLTEIPYVYNEITE